MKLKANKIKIKRNTNAFQMPSGKTLAKFFSLLALSASFGAVLTSFSLKKNTSSKSDSTSPIFPDFNTNKKGTIPATIADVISKTPTFTYVSSNEYGLSQNYQDFSENYSLDTYTGSSTEIKNDIYYLGYLLWSQNGKNFTISDVSLNNYDIKNEDSTKIVFGKSSISFDLTLNIQGIQSTTVTILDKNYSIENGKNYTLKISVKNQTINSCVNSLSDEFAIGWKVNSATISWNNDSYTNSFTPTLNSFSYAFPYKVKGLTTKSNYLQLYSQYESSILDLSSSDLKTQISNKFNTQYQATMYYIENGTQIIGILSTNPTVKDLIYKSIPYITKILVAGNYLPSYLAPLINDAFDGGKSAKSFVEVIQEYKDLILTFLENTLGSVASLASTYLDLLKPNLSSDSTDYKNLKNFFNTLGLSDQIQNLIFNDLIGVDGKTPKTLLDIIYDNIDLIVSLIDPSSSKSDSSNDDTSSNSSASSESSSTTTTSKSSSIIKTLNSSEVSSTSSNSNSTSDSSDNTSSNTTLSAIVTIIKLLLSKNTTTNEYNKFFDILSGDEKTTFYNAVIQIVGSGNSYITSVLSLIVESNENFTTNNILSFVTSLYNFAQEMFKRNDGYTSFLDSNAYTNLTFHSKFTKEPTIDKTNKTISFSYQIYYTLNKKIDFSPVIASFKKLLSTNTISGLLNKFMGVDLDTMLGKIPIVGDLAKERTITALLKYIPDSVWFGANSGETFYKKNQTTITYSATNANLWFYPIKTGDSYYLGYQFPYNMNVKLDDPSFTNSITKNYNYKTNAVSLMNVSDSNLNLNLNISIDFYFYDFWKSILKNVILRDYDTSEIYTSDAIGNESIATIYTYSPNLYTSGLVLKNSISSLNVSSLLSSFNPDDASNSTTVASSYMTTGALYSWKDGNGGASLYGAKPKLSSSLEQAILSQVYSLKDETATNKTLANTNLNFSTSVIPIENFNLPVKVIQKDYNVNVDMKLRVFILSVNVYSPIKYYDTSSSKLINSISNLFINIGASSSS